jgi:phospholipid/cholesterol/gamma-HCH transport system permease protein
MRQLFDKLEFESPRILVHGVLEDSEVQPVRDFLDSNRREVMDSGQLILDFSDSTGIDSVPAVVLHGFCKELRRAGVRARMENAPDSVRKIFESMAKFDSKAGEQRGVTSFRELVAAFGENGYEFIVMISSLITFLLETVGAFVQLMLHPLKIRWQMVLYYMEESGYKAIPIVAVLNWLLGVVLGYQAGFQMRVFGAETFMPALLGYSITWEIGPMLAAVLVAGRSGSAYAAEIGTMQVREEVDALRVMGFDTFSYLVTPKMMALLMVMPFLVLLANISGIFGGLLAGTMFLGLPAETFISELGKALIPLNIIWGMLKSIVYAVIIANVGSFMGMKVRGGASAVGQATTAAVVLSIFMVILADALLSLLIVHIRPGLSM